ncbi:unnamed protein product [Durusdinium trenchii]|uniref:Uncharacterized protein n=2 Tax=Durusdinium trenchii TaxID=1381693 RepID=A0ABP0MLS4_9DINO
MTIRGRILLLVWIGSLAYRPEYDFQHALQPLQAGTGDGKSSVSLQQRDEDNNALATAKHVTDASKDAELPDVHAKEKEAIAQLAKLWGYEPKSIPECWKAKETLEILHVDKGFDVTCQNGSIVMMGIKRASQARAQVRLSDLNAPIRDLQRLRALVLDGSHITGRLQELKDWDLFDRLERLHMRWCNIDGELKHFNNFTNLKYLKLSGHKIQGSLEQLEEDFWKNIIILDLRSTSVTGDVSSENLKASKLKGLWLQNTNITGDVMNILSQSPDMKYLHLQKTQVHGYMVHPRDFKKDVNRRLVPTAKTEAQDSELQEVLAGQKLLELVLYNTAVQFDIKPPFDQAPFPELAKLDVTGCNLSMDVWDFLFPFANTSYKLAEVRAAKCDLYGTVEGVFAAKNRPMRWQVSVLDLSQNNITRLLGKPRPCWVDLSNNSNLNEINPDYFKDTTFLDIRNTSYNGDEEEIWNYIEKEELTGGLWKCAGVRPKKPNGNGISRGRVLVTPDTFAAKRLCSCMNKNMVKVVKEKPCCGCKKGMVALNVSNTSDWCYSCFGPGCDLETTCFTDDADKQCANGYTGSLCASCKPGWRSKGFAQCETCKSQETQPRAPVICLVTMSALLLAGLSLWKYVWRPPERNTATEQGKRLLELLEQLLLVLSYCQLLYAILSVHWRASTNEGEQNEGVKFSIVELVLFDFGWLVDVLSVQCLLGYKDGRNFEVLVSIFALPALGVAALILGLCKWRSPFYGLKYAIAITSIAFQTAILRTIENQFLCQARSKMGFLLEEGAFLRPRPFIACGVSNVIDPLRYRLCAALAINGALIPGGLCLLGVYITRQIQGVQGLLSSINPVIQCDASNPDTVTLHFATVQVAAEKLPLSREDLGVYVDLPSQAMWIHAAAYVVCIAESIGSTHLEVVEADFSTKVPEAEVKKKSLDVLKLKLTKDAHFKEFSGKSQQIVLQEARAHAQRLSKRLLYRAIAKRVTTGPIWVGVRNSFHRFADKDPLICEGLQKFFLLAMARMCAGAEDPVDQMHWIAAALAATTSGIVIAKPFGSKSRNDLATVCFGALSCTAGLLCINGFSVLQFVPSVVVALFFLHLQLMPGDIMLQTHWLQAEMREQLGVSEDQPDEMKDTKEDNENGKTRDHKERMPTELPLELPLQTSEWNAGCPAWCSELVMQYRGLTRAVWHRRRSSSLALLDPGNHPDSSEQAERIRNGRS